MRFLLSTLFALCVSSSLVHGAAVTKLDAASFRGFVETNEVSLVEFFAPWCGHCKALAPEFEAAATALKPDNIPLAAVDCTVEKDLCSEFGVSGFPTLKIFRSSASNPSDYNGGRKQADIVKYMKKQVEPAYVIATSADQIQSLASAERDGVLLVGLFSSVETDDAKAFLQTANLLRNDHAFTIITEPSFVSSLTESAPSVPSVILLKKEEDPTTPKTIDAVITSGPFDTASLTTFIKAESFPLIGEIGPENFQKYMERGFPFVWMFVDKAAADKTEATLAAARKVAATVKSELSFVYLDGIKWAEHAKHFGLKSGELPGIVLEDREEGKNYIFPFQADAAVSEAALQEWVNSWKAKTLQPNLKSQPVPADNSGPLTTVVGKNFDEVVLNDSKDVLVEFYAPWCGHCKQLAPKYEALANVFADNDKVVIAQVDATENDTPAKVKGFPTLIFYRAGDKKNPLNYEGERTTEALAAWVRANGNTFKNAAGATEEAGKDEL